MAARIGGKALAERAGIEQARLEQAKVLVQGLSRLKGAAMKLGQTASVELRDLLPPEVVDALSTLQDQGSAMSGAEIRAILEREGVLSKLESLSESPLASASMGQVHGARYRGEDVVVKVQFPGIANTVESDIEGLGLLFRGFLKVTGREVRIDSFLEELSSIFKQETDYRLEAGFIEEFSSGFASLGEVAGGYRIPRVYREISNERVLVMSREPGLKPLDWVKLRRPSQELRNAVARRFLDLYELEFFRLGLVQTDPNFANFLIDDSKDRNHPVITLLDFGAAKRFDPVFVRDYQRLLQLTESPDPGPVLEQCRALGLIDPREGPEVSERLVELIRTSIRPFSKELQPFDFSDADYVRDTREAALRLTTACRYSPPPRAILFLHRKLGGLFNLAKAMEARLDLHEFWVRLGRPQSGQPKP